MNECGEQKVSQQTIHTGFFSDFRVTVLHKKTKSWWKSKIIPAFVTSVNYNEGDKTWKK